MLISGIDSNQTGLFSGGYYQVGTAGALTMIAINESINSLDDIVYVKAISSTEIIV